jgi:hypothetical protein
MKPIRGRLLTDPSSFSDSMLGTVSFFGELVGTEPQDRIFGACHSSKNLVSGVSPPILTLLIVGLGKDRRLLVRGEARTARSVSPTETSVCQLRVNGKSLFRVSM